MGVENKFYSENDSSVGVCGIYWQCRCAGVGRDVDGGLGINFNGELEIDNDEVFKLVVEYEVDYDVNSFIKLSKINLM